MFADGLHRGVKKTQSTGKAQCNLKIRPPKQQTTHTPQEKKKKAAKNQHSNPDKPTPSG